MTSKNKPGRPLKFKTTEEVQKKINKYFKSCWEQKVDMFGAPIFFKDAAGKKTKKPVMKQARPYTITGLAVALGTDRHTLINYEAKAKFFHTIKSAKDICHQYAEDFLFKGKNPTGAIFSLKNNYGWKNEIELPTDEDGKPMIAGFTFVVPVQKPADVETISADKT